MDYQPGSGKRTFCHCRRAPDRKNHRMKIAWTTVEKKTDAERLASLAVEARLAACAQIDGPIQSVYRWREAIERAQEYRLTFKCLPELLPALEQLMHSQHPYETPEWIVVAADSVSEKYLSWARSTTSPSPL